MALAGLMILYAALGILIPMLAAWDYARMAAGQPPYCAWRQACLKDGGTVEYQGLGYKLFDMHRIHETESGQVGTLLGPRLHYQAHWIFPWLRDRGDVRFEPAAPP